MQPPPTDRAVLPPSKVEATPDGGSDGRFYPIRAGLWAYVDRDRGQSLRLSNGDLVSYTARTRRGGQTRHLFGVLVSRDWGHLMQRLDGNTPPATMQTGELTPIAARRPAVPSMPRVCVGRGLPDRSHPCLGNAPRGFRWFLYPTASPGEQAPTRSLAVPEEIAENAPSLPVERLGLLHRGLADGELSLRGGTINAETGWVAVPAPHRWPDPPRMGIGVTDRCPALRSRLENNGVETVELSIDALPTHPLGIEGRAFETGVDLLVDCAPASGRVHVAIPTLLRRGMTTLHGDTLGPPLLGQTPRSLAREAATPGLLRGLAALATGDPMLADMELERWLRRSDFKQKTVRRFATVAAQIPAAAGRPEAALRMAMASARSDWHPEVNIGWQLSRAAAMAAFDRRNRYVAHLKKARDQAEAAGQDDMWAWLTWSRMDVRLEGDDIPRAGFDRLVDRFLELNQPAWATVARLLDRLEHGGNDEDPEALGRFLRRAETQDAHLLARAVTGTVEPLDCPDSAASEGVGCRLDVYGRRLEALAAQTAPDRLVAALLSAGRADFQPGYAPYAPTREDLTPATAVEIAAMLLARNDPGGRRAPASSIEPIEPVTVLSSQLSAMIDDRACPKDGLHPGVLSYLEGPVRGASATPKRADAAHFLLSDWLEGVCRAPARAAVQLREETARNEALVPFAGRLLPALVASASDDETRRRVIDEAGAFAVKHRTLADFCKRWHLAVAAAESTRGRPKEAERALAQAVNCPDVEELKSTEALLAAYVAFERTGELPRRVNHRVEARLKPLIGRTRGQRPAETGDVIDITACPALDPFGYDITRALDERVARLAAALTVVDAPTDDTLTLQTSTDRLRTAVETLDTAKSALKRGDLEKGRAALDSAAEAFESLDYRPGRSQARFLNSAIFGEDSEETVREGECPDTLEPPPAAPRELRCLLKAGDAARWLEEASLKEGDASYTGHALLAASLLFEGAEDTRRRLQELAERSEAAAALCRPRFDERN